MKGLRRFAAIILASSAIYAVALSSIHYFARGWKPHRVEAAWILFGLLCIGVLLTGIVRPSGTTPARAPGPSRKDLLLLGCILCAAVLIYAPALGVGFLSDDFVLLELSHSASGWAAFYRPLPLWLFRIVDACSSSTTAAAVLHTISLTLHLFNGLLVWRIAAGVHAPPGAGVIAVGIFLLLPASVEAVVWGAAVQDVMAATASLVLIVVALGRGPAVAMLPACAAALLSKESSVVAPFIAASLVLARDGRVERRTAVPLAVAGAGSLIFAAWRINAAGGGYLAIEPTRYVVKTILSMAFGSLAVPLWSSELHRAPAAGIFMAAAAAGLAGAGVLAVRDRRTARVLVALIAWIAAAVLPAYTWFFIGSSLEGGRHLYFPAAGFAVLVGLAATVHTGGTGRMFRATALALLVTYAAFTRAHAGAWERAAAERDRIIVAAERVHREGCRTPHLVGATDSIDGAYVFRNGLEEALRRRGLRRGTPDRAESCRFRWNGTKFEAAETGTGTVATPANGRAP